MNWLHLFTVILLVAKIMKAIDISWWLVFAPSILSIGLTLVAMIGFAGLVILLSWLGIKVK